MGIKRMNRARLHSVEKEGKNVVDSIGASDFMKNCISSATQHREGYKLTTDIIIDLGSSKQTVISGGAAAAALDVLGHGTSGSYICKLDEDVFGVVTNVETVCLEAPVGSAGVLTGANAFQLVYGDNDGVLNSPAGNDAAITADIGTALGLHTLKEYNARDVKDKYLYVALGSQATTAVGTATAEITVTDTTGDNIGTGVTLIRLLNAAGTAVDFVAHAGTAFGGSAAANKFNYGSVATAAQLAQGIAMGIDNHANFSASPTNGSSATITVTTSAAGVGGNQTNYLVDDPQLTAGISVGAFSGGTTKGDANEITAGKLLLRLTGFVIPPDL